MKRLSWFSTLLLAMGTPALAVAADGYVTANVNLRAGPDIGYPRIDTLPAGVMVNIYGCTEGWGWCDVSYGPDRGWVAGNYIDYYQDGSPWAVPDYGARIGIPIISFVIGTYWGEHYSHRSFYRQRDYWYRRPVVHRPPPPPPSHHWYRPGTRAHYQPGHPGYRPSGGSVRPGDHRSGNGNPGHAPGRPNPARPPARSGDDHQGGRPGQSPARHVPATPRPAPSARPTNPRPSHQGAPAAHPAPSHRPAPASRPAPAARQANPPHGQAHPAPARGSAHNAPARNHNEGKGKSDNRRKGDHRGH